MRPEVKVRVLKKLFQGKLLAALKAAVRFGETVCPGESSGLVDKRPSEIGTEALEQQCALLEAFSSSAALAPSVRARGRGCAKPAGRDSPAALPRRSESALWRAARRAATPLGVRRERAGTRRTEHPTGKLL